MCTDVYFQQLLIWLLYFFFFNVKKYVLFIKNYVQLINSPVWLQTLVTSYNAQVTHIMLNISGKPIQFKAALWHMVWKLPQQYKVTGWESTKLNQPNTSWKIHGTGSEHRETKPQKLSLQFFAHSYRNIPTAPSQMSSPISLWSSLNCHLMVIQITHDRAGRRSIWAVACSQNAHPFSCPSFMHASCLLAQIYFKQVGEHARTSQKGKSCKALYLEAPDSGNTSACSRKNIAIMAPGCLACQV